MVKKRRLSQSRASPARAGVSKKRARSEVRRVVRQLPFGSEWLHQRDSKWKQAQEVFCPLLREFLREARAQALLICGANAVMRALEKRAKEIYVVLVALKSKAALRQQLPSLCGRGAVCAVVDFTSEELGTLVGLRSAIAVGIIAPRDPLARRLEVPDIIQI